MRKDAWGAGDHVTGSKKRAVIRVRPRWTLGKKLPSIGDMATGHSPSAGNLGTIPETDGGRSLRRIFTVGVADSRCGLTATMLIRVVRPDDLGLMLWDFVFGSDIALTL